MAKILKYNLCVCVNHGTKKEPEIEKFLSPVIMGWSEENEAIAKRESYNGEYTIEDDGMPEPAPSKMDVIEAQVTYTAMMTNTLLEV